jgi:hypothetical protein
VRRQVRGGVLVLPVVFICIAGLVETPAAGAAQAKRPSVHSLSAHSGKLTGGARVAVTGAGFSHVKKVVFGRSTARVVRHGSTRGLTVIVPRHAAGRVDVHVVTTHGSSSVTSHDRYTFVAPPALTTVSAAKGPISGGTRVTLTGARFTSGSVVTFGGTRATKTSVLSSARIQAVAPRHAAGTSAVRVSNVYGASTTRAFTYVPPPEVTNIDVPSDGLRAGMNVSLTGRNFFDVTSVTFNAMAATIVSRSESALTVTVPDVYGPTAAIVVIGRYGASDPISEFMYPKPTGGLPEQPTVTSHDVYFYTHIGSSYYYRVLFTWTLSEPSPTTVVIRRSNGAVAPATLTDGVQLQEESASFNGWNDQPLLSNTTYSYSLFAHNAVGYSAPTSFTIVTGPELPGPLHDVHVIPHNATTVSLDWREDSDPFTAVAIRRNLGATPPATPQDGVPVADVAQANGSYLDTALEPGTTYSYTLFPHNATGGYADVTSRSVTTFLPGKGWTEPHTIDPAAGGVSAMSCPTAEFCAAVDGYGNVLTFNGTQWSAAHWIEPDTPLAAVSCTSSSFCVALDYNWRSLVMRGSQWSAPMSGPGDGVQPRSLRPAISCAAPTFCISVADGLTSVFDGSSWSPGARINVDEDYLASVSCPAVGHCVAVSTGGLAYRYDTGTWSGATQIRPLSGSVANNVTSISCPTITFCAVSDVFGEVVVMSGGTWSPPQNALFTDYYNSTVACASPQFCIASSGRSTSVFDGQNWSAPEYIEQTTSASGVAASCVANGVCRLVHSNGDVFTHDGIAWSAPTTIDPYAGALQAVSCPTATFCITVDGFGNDFVYDGTSWSKAARATGMNRSSSVSCPDPAYCVLVDRVGKAAVRTGDHWSEPTQVTADMYRGLVSVSCTSAQFCVAAGDQGDLFRFDGTTWHSYLRVGGWFTSVSCVSPTFCTAVSAQGWVYRFDGTAWASVHSVRMVDAQQLTSVSCVSAVWCIALTSRSTYLIWDGSAWTDHVAGPDLGTDDGPRVTTVSCLSSHFCVAVYNTYAATFDGNTWTYSRGLTATSHRLDALSCGSPSLCTAVGGGDVVTLRP